MLSVKFKLVIYSALVSASWLLLNGEKSTNNLTVQPVGRMQLLPPWTTVVEVGSGVFPQFMQRGLDAETKKQLEEDEKRIISDEHWYLDLPELKTKE